MPPRVQQRWSPSLSCPPAPPGPGQSRAEPLPTPACTAGREPRGSPEAPRCVWDREQSRCFSSPPARADFLLGVFTSFARQLPMGTSQTEAPVRPAVPAGSGTPSPCAHRSCCPKGPAAERGCAGTPEPFLAAPPALVPLVDAVGEAEVCLPLQIGSKPAEQLWY